METILIVEDNQQIRSEMTDLFKMENFEVIEAANGLDGFIKAVNNLPDIIISDIMMPVIDGYKMFQELKKNPMTAQIPIIFLSALSTNEDIRKGMNMGVEDYLTKPVDYDDLVTTTENKLEKYSEFEKKYEIIKADITNILYHEINTPLNAVIGFSDYLKTQVHVLSKDNIKKIADNIYSGGKRLHKLVKRYLIYSELRMNSTNISGIKKMRNCDYIDTVKVINEVTDLEKFKHRKEDFEISTEPVELKIEEHLFRLLIEELTDNAVKFSSSGKKISINTYIENGSYILKIKNQGSGLSKEEVMQINDFNQINNHKYAQNGSGIGLSIVKMITDIYGEDFEIESIPKTFFSVILSFKRFIKK
ncbi:MAG: hybrid sensor histidine kinase/response regulator [Bacteroidales bacterium]|nr:hybrid sensor histidine kinase/response regulator [Bacteroidales bacterium]